MRQALIFFTIVSPIGAYIYMRFAGIDVGPVEGTTMVLVIALGVIIGNKLIDEEERILRERNKIKPISSPELEVSEPVDVLLEEAEEEEEEEEGEEEYLPNKEVGEEEDIESNPAEEISPEAALKDITITQPSPSTQDTKIREDEGATVIATPEANNLRRVNYTTSLSENFFRYPSLKIPNYGCVVRTHRTGRLKRRGYKEESFEQAISYFFAENYQVFGNVKISTGPATRAYEPDIAIMCSTDKNIRIDIEIDEPYAGITRQPTHCKGDNLQRDIYFTDRGWIVIRFSEYQVHTQLNQCLKFLATVVNSLDPSFTIPQVLIDTSDIAKEEFWTRLQAQKWEKEKYRENYLGHEFSLTEETNETDEVEFDNQEEEEEKLVQPSFPGVPTRGKEIHFNSANSHTRDHRIKFYSEDHVYTIDGVPAPSASTIISGFFPEFDSEYWAKKKAPQLGKTPEEVAALWEANGKESMEKGTFLHDQIENYFLGLPYEETEEFIHFRNFINDHPGLNPFRTEWRIFDDKVNVAGTIDCIVQTQEGYDIYDWKRSKKVVNSYDGKPIIINNWQQGIGGLFHIDDTSFNRYSLQQSLYKYILEENYNFNVNNMHLVIMHPENQNYFKVKVPYLKDEVKYILRTI